MNRLFLLILIFFACPLEGIEKAFIQLDCRDTGMFSIFTNVLHCLDDYEKGTISGFTVDFRSRGAYFDKDYGPNWWEYYCQPIFLGIKESKKIKRHHMGVPRLFSPEEAYMLIQKHIQIKPHVTKRVEDFVNANFGNCFVIGLHYRGTDKIVHAPRVAYEEVIKVVQTKVASLAQSLAQEYKIFVATDEQAFIDFIMTAFPGKICYQTDVIRSTDDKPLHVNAKMNRYKLGEDALTDCLLLSKTDFLIRTSSNLSLWSTYFNPTIPVLELNQRYKKGKK